MRFSRFFTICVHQGCSYPQDFEWSGESRCALCKGKGCERGVFPSHGAGTTLYSKSGPVKTGPTEVANTPMSLIKA